MQPVVVAQQVDEELAVADDKWVLLADNREADAELEQQPAQVCQQRGLKVGVPVARLGADKVQDVRVAGDLLRQVGVVGRQGCREVRRSCPLA